MDWSWGALRAVLKHFAASWGGLGGLLEPLGMPLGASWGLLSASWEPLGASWANLEATKTAQKYDAKKGQLPDPSTSNRPLLWGGFWELKIDQNGIQNESKFKTIFKSEKIALQDRLGAVLDRSWGILEAILGAQYALRY